MSVSFDDFISAAKSAGMLGQFSAADLKLAQTNPAAGMSILSYKKDYAAATTDEARALANAGAEKVRKSYGNYSGGADGSAEIKDSGYVNQTVSAASLSSYEGEAEKNWTDYRRQYLREGQLAYQNSLGQAAANTGGIASTAAVAAAQQAQNYYASQAADKKAELYQQAYENWLADRSAAVSENALANDIRSTEAAIAAKQTELDNETRSVDASIAAKQTELENEARSTEAELEAQKAKQALEEAAAEAEQKQQAFENAMSKWKAYGYVTADIADALALPVGTAYSDQAYNEWKQAFEEAKSGVATGQTAYDTVNRGSREENDQASAHATVRYGSKNSDVSTMQRYLISLGYSCGSSGADGKFGYGTHRALLSFQRAQGLSEDGICGPLTWAALIQAVQK